MWLGLELESYLDLTCVHLKERVKTFSESRQKDSMNVIPGRLNFVSLGMAFSWKLRQRLILERATYLFLPMLNVTKREEPSLCCQCTTPGTPLELQHLCSHSC